MLIIIYANHSDVFTMLVYYTPLIRITKTSQIPVLEKWKQALVRHLWPINEQNCWATGTITYMHWWCQNPEFFSAGFLSYIDDFVCVFYPKRFLFSSNRFINSSGILHILVPPRLVGFYTEWSREMSSHPRGPFIGRKNVALRVCFCLNLTV